MAMNLRELTDLSITRLVTDADTFGLHVAAVGDRAPRLDADERARGRAALEALRGSVDAALEKLKE